ncbi:hypothetical protein MASR2M48_02070 [Spirochaetota bacterium]
MELYRALVYAPRAVGVILKNRKNKWLGSHFIERLQLAVTEVNGCAACSYYHIKIALQQNMSNKEKGSFLNGSGEFIKPEEAKAIMFVQHFADARGFPMKFAYDAIITEYGEQKARVILAAAQTMIAGNMYGIPLSALHSRLKGKPYKCSSLFYELGLEIAGFICLPIAIIHGLLRGLLGLSNERLDTSVREE